MARPCNRRQVIAVLAGQLDQLVATFFMHIDLVRIGIFVTDHFIARNRVTARSDHKLRLFEIRIRSIGRLARSGLFAGILTSVLGLGLFTVVAIEKFERIGNL